MKNKTIFSECFVLFMYLKLFSILITLQSYDVTLAYKKTFATVLLTVD
ncbi:hypothetical protein [Tenacibaculum amylolyticum]